MTQLIIGSKHSGGVAGATKGQQGFPVLDRLISIPSTFPGGAAHAQEEGSVDAVRDAPQGGRYVVVGGREHYVPADQEVTVKPGDKVEPGDTLSDGVPNPAEFVEHKGIGEGRRRFVDTFLSVARASGFNPDRRNVELVARGLIDHVRVDKELGEYAPGEIASYTALAADYRPRPDAERLAPHLAVGRYLERPALHHTIGTRVTRSMVPEFEKFGVTGLDVHPEPPPFTPVMIRSHDVLAHDRDWTTQMLGSNLEKNLLRSVARGAVADPTGTSFVPALAEGTRFGSPGLKTTGWSPPPPPASPLTPPSGL